MKRRGTEELDFLGAVSARTGIIQRLMKIPLHHDDPLVYSYGAAMADTTRYSPHQCNLRNGGAGLTEEHAIRAAVGESLERYCSNFYDHRSLTLGAFREFPDRVVHPGRWTLFSKRQYQSANFPLRELTEESVIAWVEAESLVTGEIKLVPAAITYQPYTRGYPEEQPFSPIISTGLSCRASRVEAMLYGAYECIERDAFTICWLNALRMPVIELGALADDELRRIVEERFVRPGIRYHIRQITLDIDVPAYFAVAVGESEIGTMVCVGAAAHLDPRRAVLKSLIECAQGRPFQRFQRHDDPDWSCKDDFSNITDFNDHARLYTERPELIPRLDFCLSTRDEARALPPDRSTGSPEEDLDKVVSMLASHGLEALVVDLTTPDVRELGFHVVRVLVPGLQPLHGDHRYPFLGGERLYQVPWRLGLRDRPATEGELFDLPHPFP